MICSRTVGSSIPAGNSDRMVCTSSQTLLWLAGLKMAVTQMLSGDVGGLDNLSHDIRTGQRKDEQLYSVIVGIKRNRKYAASVEKTRHPSALISVCSDASSCIHSRREERQSDALIHQVRCSHNPAIGRTIRVRNKSYGNSDHIWNFLSVGRWDHRRRDPSSYTRGLQTSRYTNYLMMAIRCTERVYCNGACIEWLSRVINCQLICGSSSKMKMRRARSNLAACQLTITRRNFRKIAWLTHGYVPNRIPNASQLMDV